MAIHNMTEEILRPRMEMLLEGFDCCKCEKCVSDMMAMALNNLKPQYVNSNKGELFSRINSTKMQISTDVDIAALKAIQLISANPHH